jgi:hypothetical protein
MIATTSIHEDNLHFDLSKMDSTAADETTSNAVVLTNKPLSGDVPLPQHLETYDDSVLVCLVSSLGSTATSPLYHRRMRQSVFSKVLENRWSITSNASPTTAALSVPPQVGAFSLLVHQTSFV